MRGARETDLNGTDTLGHGVEYQRGLTAHRSQAVCWDRSSGLLWARWGTLWMGGLSSHSSPCELGISLGLDYPLGTSGGGVCVRGAGLRLEAGKPFGLAQVRCAVVYSRLGRTAGTGSEKHPAVARQRSAQPQAQALAWGSALAAALHAMGLGKGSLPRRGSGKELIWPIFPLTPQIGDSKHSACRMTR